LELINTTPSRIVTEVANLLRPRAQAKGLDLIVRYDSPIPDKIRSDPTRLRQILLNLTGNAIKFTEQGNVTIAVDFVRDAQQLRFRVIDTGIDLTVAQQDQLTKFAAFTQADSSTTRKFGGSGLGLRISHALATMLGGGIEIESEYGTGSVFVAAIGTGGRESEQVALQHATSSPAEVREQSRRDHRNSVQSQKQLLGRRILLAEDGLDNQRLISFILSKSGAEVELADDGEIAVEKALAAVNSGRPFDVILMDMQMPVLDGYQATHRLRGQDYDGPIIALTAHAMTQDRQKCLDFGCDDYLSKPIDRRKLIELVATHAAARKPTHRG